MIFLQSSKFLRQHSNSKKKHSKFYIPIKVKFFICFLISIIWLWFSYEVSKPWLTDLSEITSPLLAVLIISGIAYIPGFMNAFLISSLILDRQPKFTTLEPTEDVTLLVAAYNEENGIYNTLKYIKNQSYKGHIKTIVIDNNSTDNTALEVKRAMSDFGLDLELIHEEKAGKFNALNLGLSKVKTEYVITLDADTLIHQDAINYLVARMKSAPKDVSAVAGSMLVRNSRDNLLAKIQEWDYFLSIASIKRMQGLFQGTLVAQGAFSLYKTDIVKSIGGWSDAIGEDIVLTWKILELGHRVYFEPFAVAFTDVPTKFSHFAKQRSRWARGMIEGLKSVKPWKQPSLYGKFLTGIDLIIPYMDFSYTFFWIPGLFLAIFHQKYHIVGPMMLLVFPLTLISFYILFAYQKSVVFKKLNLKVRKNAIGFIFFIMFYQMIMSPVSLVGYIQELFGSERVWK